VVRMAATVGEPVKVEVKAETMVEALEVEWQVVVDYYSCCSQVPIRPLPSALPEARGRPRDLSYPTRKCRRYKNLAMRCLGCSLHHMTLMPRVTDHPV